MAPTLDASLKIQSRVVFPFPPLCMHYMSEIVSNPADMEERCWRRAREIAHQNTEFMAAAATCWLRGTMR